MDKRVIFAVAGSGKTTYIIDSLDTRKRALIVTYTDNNYENLRIKILQKFDGIWPSGIVLMTYFRFLYRFCYKPFLADVFHAKGVIFEANTNNRIPQTKKSYYITKSGYLYSNRLTLLLEKAKVIDDIKKRIETYFDEFIIDEVQDIAGRDFTFLEHLMSASVNMLFVGDYYQHTYDTSRDGNVNKSLFSSKTAYEKRFSQKGFVIDSDTLTRSWRCGPAICEYITKNLNITISSNKQQDDSKICFVSSPTEIERLLSDPCVVKLHYQKSGQYGAEHKNWGDTKGEDCYQDVCVCLNKKTMELYSKGRLNELAPGTRNKLYVAITRAHGNCFLIKE